MPSAALFFLVSVVPTAFAHAPILDEQHGVITVARSLSRRDTSDLFVDVAHVVPSGWQNIKMRV
jgi:hypothetical protein